MVQRTAYVYFASSDWTHRSRMGWRRRLRIARRFPRKTWWWALGAAVRWQGSFPAAHVAVGCNGVVLDPHISGNRFWPLIAFTLAYPTLLGCYEVPTPRPPDLDRFPPRGPKSPWPTILRWLTRGRWPTEDCVAVAVDVLRHAGVDVPPRTYNPRQLAAWLQAQGYRYVAFTDSGLFD